MIAAGTDVGSVTTKAVLFEEGRILVKSVIRKALPGQDAVYKILSTCLEKIGRSMEEVGWVINTGMPIKSLLFPGENKNLVKCLAVGIRYFIPTTRTVIDVGAENSTVIGISKEGFIDNYSVNDNCAAGAGIYLEAMARLTGNDLEEMINKANRARYCAPINSTCTVFAEQEVISSAFSDPPIPIDSILLGIHESLAIRISGLVYRVGVKEDVCICGGVAKNQVFVKSLAKRLKVEIKVVDEPEMVAAFGAGLLALDHLKHNGEIK